MKRKKLLICLSLFSTCSLFSQTDPFYRAPVVTGLVSHWSMENNTNDVEDGNDPVATNNISFGPGRLGQSVTLGSGGYIDIPNSANLELQTYTLESWVNPTGPGPNNDVFGSVIIEKDIDPPFGNDNASASLGWSAISNRFYVSCGSFADQIIFSNNFFPPGLFYHVSGTFDGSVLKLYVNGNLEAQQNITAGYVIPYSPGQTWNIGSSGAYYRSIGYARTFNGAIDEVKIYDRALSPAEVVNNYNYTANNGFFTGRIFNDVDDNCFFSPVDLPISHYLVKAVPGPYYTYTDNDGNYEFLLPQGSYTVTSEDVNNLYDFSPCQSTTSFSVNVLPNTTLTGINFALKPMPPTCGVSVNIASLPNTLNSPVCNGHPLVTPCPQYQHEYCITFTNTGNTPIIPGSTLQVTIDPNMSFAGVLSNPCGLPAPSPSGNVISWNIGSALPAGSSCTVCIAVDVLAGSNWTTSAIFDADCPAGGSFAATDSHFDGSACACDPNDKIVTPIGCGTEGSVNMDETLTYKVRFENIGTGNAHNVVVRDYLDADLDFASLKLIESSHTITRVQLLPGNILVFDFEGIELPGIQDEPYNKGYLIFSLDPKVNLDDATQISNYAAIYFDENEPVITNTTLNTLREQPSPIADFASKHSCTSTGFVYDFKYTGGTVDGTSYDWQFGPGVVPATSALMDPSGIAFTGVGSYNVTLNLERYGCTSSITKAVVVEDVHCGKNNDRISVCINGNTVCVAPQAVAALVNNGACVGSCENTFKNAITSNEMNEPKTGFIIYPNPFNAKAFIEFSVEDDENVSIELLDAAGNRVKNIFNAEVSANVSHKIEIDRKTLASGLYFCTIVTASGKQVQKITITD